ncbi:hypothetical protein WA158_007593 [Blastocystis sp. Blastoise]
MKGPWESIAVGIERGHHTEKMAKVERPIAKKGNVKFARELIREVIGLLPYEKHMMDQLKAGGNNVEKRLYKFAKKRLGGHKRALLKRDEVKELYAKARRHAAHAHHKN